MTRVLWMGQLWHEVQATRKLASPDGMDLTQVRTSCLLIDNGGFSRQRDGATTCMFCVSLQGVWEHVQKIADDVGISEHDLDKAIWRKIT